MIERQGTSPGNPLTMRMRVGLWMLGVTTLVPVIVLVVRALAVEWRYPAFWPASLSGGAFALMLAPGRVREALGVSVTLACATAIGAAVLGYGVARTVHRLRGWPRRFAVMTAFLPVVAPPVALGTGLQVAALAAGLGGTWTGVWLSHLVPASGYVTLYFWGVLDALDHQWEESARALGATRGQTFWRITLPMLWPRLADALWLGALVSWGQLALTLIVGGGVVRTLPVELLAVLRSGDDRLGSAAAIVLTIVPVVGLVATRIQWRSVGTPP